MVTLSKNRFRSKPPWLGGSLAPWHLLAPWRLLQLEGAGVNRCTPSQASRHKVQLASVGTTWDGPGSFDQLGRVRSIEMFPPPPKDCHPEKLHVREPGKHGDGSAKPGGMTSRVSSKEGVKRGLPAKEKGFATARRHAKSEDKAETTRRACRVPNPYVRTSCVQDSASVPPTTPNSEDAVSRTYWETQQGSDHCLQAGPHSVTVPHLAHPTQPTPHSVRNGTQQRAGGAGTRVRQNHTG